MDWLKLPPLNSLRAFAVVAETGSLTSAAKRLNVTHAAVSQQLKRLETLLGQQRWGTMSEVLRERGEL